MKHLYFFLFLFFPFSLFSQQKSKIKISNDGHTFQYENGTPFFWLGDTAWELFHRLTKEEIDFYLETRKTQGYTIIQAVILPELLGFKVPNRYGEFPLVNKNPDKPNEAYFKLIDYTLQKAASLDIQMALLPTWGRYWTEDAIFTSKNAFRYGKYIGERYKDQWNIVWILGGDRIPKTQKQFDIIKQMALGLKAGGSSHLITFHPTGDNTSLTFFQKAKWIDFHMAQSGHNARDNPNYLYPLNNYFAKPTKPFIDGEPRYEDLPVRFWEIELKKGYAEKPFLMADSLTPYGYFNAYDVRRAAYWSVFSGAAGITYGNGSIWCFWEKGRYAPIAIKHNWKTAMNSAGGRQMQYLKKLINKYGGLAKFGPNRSLIGYNWSKPKTYQSVLFSKDKSTALIYIPDGKPIQISQTKFINTPLYSSWYNPRNGSYSQKEMVNHESILLQFTPSSQGKNNDWVLILTTK